MADEETVIAEQPAKSGGMMKMLMFAGIGIALLATGIFAGPVVMNMISPAEVNDAEVGEEVSVENKDPEIYQSLHPALVVNFQDSSGDSHFMQITLELMSRDQEVINAVRDHTPVIRNALILMFGATNYESAVTREGKEQMLNDALAEVQSVMNERIGEPGVEAVYFTSLVIQ
jgi:flagellar protein FliL